VSLFSFEIDPLQVLGVSAEASLEQIRDAYRQKAKKYHPDAGGEDWSFRILSQAYELLCSARVVRAAQVEPAPRPGRAAPRPGRAAPRPGPGSSSGPKAETVHAGIHDKDVDPSRVVALEHLCVRYLWDDASYLWLTQGVPEDERFLSCSLNLSWPDGPRSVEALPLDDRPGIIAVVGEVFEMMAVSTRVVASRSRVEQDRFAGWLSYSSFERSWKALNTLHEALRRRGLGLRQWSRDLFLPRAWRGDRSGA
jgi:hypothetical protein